MSDCKGTELKFLDLQNPIKLCIFALCNFANFGSVAILLGGIGELAPNQRKNLARLGLRALICGTLTGYLSAAIVGILF